MAAMPSEKVKKAVLDLEYRIPDTLKTRYHAIGGKFYSAVDGKTVLFEDKGRQLKTPLQDPQTVKDMLEVVKAKGWDSIKISGSKEFRQIMYIEAAAQGIKTSGYTPTQADLQQVEALRERYAKNGIEPVLTREQERQAETAKPEQEKVKSEPEPEHEERVRSEPNREILAAAERMKAQSTMPSERQVNSSPRADTDIDVPLHTIGQEEVPAEVVHQTDNMKAAALDTRFVSAKTVYTEKAQKLNKSEQKKLAFYERGVMDTLRGLEGQTRTRQTATSTRQQTHYRSFARKRPFLFGNSCRAAPQQRKRCSARYCAGVYPQASVLVGSRSGSAVSVQLPAFEYRS